MPKQKIDVNENLNVSIGELLIPKSAENTEQYSEELSKDKLSGNSSAPLENDAKSNINDSHTDIKKMIPKIGKIFLQHQRSGRGGKTVTLVSIGEAKAEVRQNLEALLRELKKSLGCGGRIEDGRIVLQGEIADRASEWFVKMGAKAVKSG